jgi:hypothetical protein
MVPALVSVCVGLLVAGCAASSETAAKDVRITSCKGSPTGDRPEAAGTIRNNSSKDSGYTIHVRFKDASGNRVGEGVAVVREVDADGTAKWDVTGTVNAKGKVTCELGNVARAAVP